ncbi:putative GPI inositol-deacylase [Seiridium cardinale]|uniref:GPI inositol-deacylase n=1 Tax=Seiridium cardinale TaxID=138064 RepID=A0ABR2XN46_9PEZI
MWKRFKGSKKNRPSSRLDEDAEPSNYSAASAKLDSFSFRSDPSDSSRPRDLEIRRKASEQSAISDIHGQLFPAPQHQRKRSEDRREDPLGLLVLHTPEPAEKRTVDILFVHGLGGTSLRTWCHGRDLDNLWPRLWLPDEDGFSSARILTYGYNAHFSSKKEQASLAIGDFANDLLFRMKYGESGPERLGQVPIVIVAHSMGGLVFKKAFIHGLLNDEFRDIISMIKSVLFLATPHRGTDLAETLNKILTSSIFGHSPKDYVSELARRSPTIDELNESFRHHASKLQIFSFYETLTTAIGPISAMILDKNTAVLGYPRETPQPLIANHHDACKFKSTDDPNYLSVLGALRSVVGPTVPKYVSEIEGNSEEDLKLVKALLGISAPPEEDLAAGRAVRKPGTCERFLASREFDEWRSSDSSRILWAHAPPGSGKSTICTLVIERLLEADEACAYFFFRYDNRQKQSIGYMLQSLAYQIAALEPEACSALAELAKAGERFQNADPVNIWKRLYLAILSNIHSRKTFYWVLDGIDESESSRQVVDFLSSINEFQSTIKILLFSRPHFTISQAMQKATTKTRVVELPLGDNKEDIRLTVAEEIIYLASDDNFKHDTVNKITSRSQGNFLWASLVVKLVASCHRQDQVERLLETTPDGMDKLYDRMLDVVATLHMPEDMNLARILLSWAMYSRTPLTVDELSEPYATEFRSVMDLKHTVNQICGQFVIINTSNQVTLVHHSAREYLRRHARQPFSLELHRSHEELFGKCLMAICDKDLRGKIQMLRVPQFLRYAATSWAFHLENCPVQSDRVLNGLTRFFKGSFPLSWIQYMTMSGHLSDLPALEAKNPRQERAVEFRFTGNDSLMMVTDLKRVYSLPTKTDNAEPSQWLRLDQSLMAETSLPEGVWLGTPTSVAFNHDCSQMAVAYRNFPLTVWSVDPPCVVARMKRRHNSAQGSQNSYTGGNKVVWHPSGGHILGIFGDIFKWSPSEDTYETVNGETGVIPHEIECTPNGLAFITGDVEGSIKIYEISSMTMIYKLTSEDGISRICLSPDSTHFYDLRGSYCNVWEPNCLMRLADVSSERFNDASSMTDSFWSDTEDTHSTSISFPASESRADNRPGIMTIALQRSATQPLAYSTDDGSIEVYHPGYDKSYKIAKSMSGISIEHLAWSDAHDQLAFSEIHGAVVVKSVTTSADSQLGLELETIYDETKTPGNRGNTRKLLFDSTGKKLFVHGETLSQVISIFDSTVKAERTNEGLENTSWLRHPTQNDQLVCLTTTEAKIFDWNLQERYTFHFSATLSTDAVNPITHAILPSYHTKLLLLRTVLVENNRRNYGFLILPTTVLTPTDPTNEPHQTLSIPKHLLEAISHPVGIIPDGRLVFLDKGLWVCTAQLNEQASITRHFFIPHDWVTSSGAQLCQVLPDGTFLCPTKGRVAIIKSSMASQW